MIMGGMDQSQVSPAAAVSPLPPADAFGRFWERWGLGDCAGLPWERMEPGRRRAAEWAARAHLYLRANRIRLLPVDLPGGRAHVVARVAWGTPHVVERSLSDPDRPGPWVRGPVVTEREAPSLAAAILALYPGRSDLSVSLVIVRDRAADLCRSLVLRDAGGFSAWLAAWEAEGHGVPWGPAFAGMDLAARAEIARRAGG